MVPDLPDPFFSGHLPHLRAPGRFSLWRFCEKARDLCVAIAGVVVEDTRMTSPAPDTDGLLAQAAQGQTQARADLLARHRQRLRNMVAYRLDRRLAARIDPSDVVQEVL